MIRDLIFAIQYLNEIAKENGFNVHAITAIRNEVYKEVRSKGLEINKPIHDFGIQISWQQKGGAIRDNPLLKMLVRRFQCSEKIRGLEPTPDVFGAYFLKSVGRSGIDFLQEVKMQTGFLITKLRREPILKGNLNLHMSKLMVWYQEVMVILQQTLQR